MDELQDTSEQTEDAIRAERISRAYAMIFWVLFGTIGSVVGTAVVVSETFTHLSPKESRRIIWSTAIPLAVSTWILGWFVTKYPRIRNWSVVGFVVLFVAMRVAAYVVKYATS